MFGLAPLQFNDPLDVTSWFLAEPLLFRGVGGGDEEQTTYGHWAGTF